MKRLLRRCIKALTPLFAVAILAFIGVTTVTPDASAQVLRRGGGGVLSREFWTESNGVLIPTNPNATLGSSSNRVAGIYADTLDAVTLTISGSVPGNLTVTGTIAVLGTGTSTFAGAVSSTRFIANDGSLSAPAFTFGDDTNTGIYSPSNGQIYFVLNGSFNLALLSTGVIANTHIRPNANAVYDIGSTGVAWRNGWFTGTVTSKNLDVTDVVSSTRYRVNGGTAALPGITGTDFDTGIYFGNDGFFVATNGTNRLTVDNSFVSFGLSARPSADNARDLGSLTVRWRDLFLSGTVSTTNAILNPSTGTPAASLCIDAGGNVIKVIGANCFP